jgi:hypothetical protein
VETAAREHQAEIVESERASLARRAFDVASRCVDRAGEILEQHPVSAVRLLATGVDVAAQVAGVARDYAVPAPTVSIVTQFIGENGQPIAAPEPVENLSLDEIEKLAAKLHEEPQALPCNDWSPDHVDATPTPAMAESDPNLPSPDYREPVPNPDILPGKPVPSRANFIPTR